MGWMKRETATLVDLSEIQPYQVATVEGRLGARKVGLSRTWLWLLKMDTGEQQAAEETRTEAFRMRLNFRGPRFDLISGRRVRVTGMVHPSGPSMLHMNSPKVEPVAGPGRIVTFRSFPCHRCGGPNPRLWSWMGLKGEGHLITGPNTYEICRTCEGNGYFSFPTRRWVALPWWVLAGALAAASTLGWLAGR